MGNLNIPDPTRAQKINLHCKFDFGFLKSLRDLNLCWLGSWITVKFRMYLISWFYIKIGNVVKCHNFAFSNLYNFSNIVVNLSQLNETKLLFINIVILNYTSKTLDMCFFSLQAKPFFRNTSVCTDWPWTTWSNTWWWCETSSQTTWRFTRNMISRAPLSIGRRRRRRGKRIIQLSR